MDRSSSRSEAQARQRSGWPRPHWRWRLGASGELTLETAPPSARVSDYAESAAPNRPGGGQEARGRPYGARARNARSLRRGFILTPLASLPFAPEPPTPVRCRACACATSRGAFAPKTGSAGRKNAAPAIRLIKGRVGVACFACRPHPQPGVTRLRARFSRDATACSARFSPRTRRSRTLTRLVGRVPRRRWQRELRKAVVEALDYREAGSGPNGSDASGVSLKPWPVPPSRRSAAAHRRRRRSRR